MHLAPVFRLTDVTIQQSRETEASVAAVVHIFFRRWTHSTQITLRKLSWNWRPYLH